jgi:hypothetical protein
MRFIKEGDEDAADWDDILELVLEMFAVLLQTYLAIHLLIHTFTRPPSDTEHITKKWEEKLNEEVNQLIHSKQTAPQASISHNNYEDEHLTESSSDSIDCPINDQYEHQRKHLATLFTTQDPTSPTYSYPFIILSFTIIFVSHHSTYA